MWEETLCQPSTLWRHVSSFFMSCCVQNLLSRNGRNRARLIMIGLNFTIPWSRSSTDEVLNTTLEKRQKPWLRMNFEEKHVQNGTGGCSGENKLHFTIPRLLPTDTHSCKNCAGTSPVCICFIRTKWFLMKIKMSLALAFLSYNSEVFHHPTFSAANSFLAPVRLCLSPRQQSKPMLQANSVHAFTSRQQPTVSANFWYTSWLLEIWIRTIIWRLLRLICDVPSVALMKL